MSALATKLINKTEYTKEEFVKENIRLVHKVCKKYFKRGSLLGLEYGDLVSIGSIGLLKAFEKFDNSFGVAISTYAIPMIQGEIQRTLRDVNPGAKFSRTIKEMSYQIEKEDSVEEIQEKLQISYKKAVEVRDCKHNFFSSSMDKQLNDDDNSEITLKDKIADYQDLTSLHVEEFMDTLSDQFKSLISGLYAGKTQVEIGADLGCSQVHVSRLIKKLQKAYLEYQERENDEMKQAQGDMAEAKRLLAETDLSVKEIAERTGTNKNSLKVYASKTKKKQNASTIAQNNPSWIKSEEEYKSLIGQLKGELEGRDDLIGKLEATIKKYQEQPANDEQVKQLNEKVAQMESACADVEDELDQYKTKLRIAADALDQSDDKLQELQATVEKYKNESEDWKNSWFKKQDEFDELNSKHSTVERELLITEENLSAANKSLRNKDAALEQLERELSYARENEQTLRENEQIFRTALKAAL